MCIRGSPAGVLLVLGHESMTSYGARAMRCVILAAILCAVPTAACAQSAVVLVSPGLEGADLERVRAGAIEALAEQGIRLVRPPEGDACRAVDCAPQLIDRAGADFVLLLAVENVEGASRVRATLVRRRDAPREAAVRIGDAGTAAAASRAVQRALAEEVDRRQGFLLVRTRPPGARVEIDGEPVGESPLRRTVAAGEHRVRIVPERGEPREESVNVVAVTETALDVDLETDGAGSETAPARTRTEASPFNWLIGGALAIAGVIALISPLQTLATEGQCVDMIDAGCRERVQFGAQSGVLLGLGVLLLAAAVVVDAWAPLRVEVAAGAGHASIGVRGSF